MKTEFSLEDRAFLLLLIAVTIAFGMILKPFFSAILWAILIVILFIPMHRKIVNLFRGRKVLSALTTLLIINLILIIPLTLIVAALGVEIGVERLRKKKALIRGDFISDWESIDTVVAGPDIPFIVEIIGERKFG